MMKALFIIDVQLFAPYLKRKLCHLYLIFILFEQIQASIKFGNLVF